jgi:hypothetical protein
LYNRNGKNAKEMYGSPFGKSARRVRLINLEENFDGLQNLDFGENADKL